MIFILALLNIAALVLIYGLKADTYDLITYTMAMDWPWVHEIGYSTLSIILKSIFHDNRTALYAVQVLLILLFCVPVLLITRKQKERFVYFLIVFLSVAFTLGVNNAIRQSFSALFVVLSLFLIFRGKLIFGFLVFTLSFLFHTSGIAFFAYSLVTYTVARMFYYPAENSFKRKLSLSVFIGLLIILGFLTYYALSMILSLGFYRDYGLQGIAVDSARTNNTIKLIIVFCVYVISELFFGVYERKESYFTNFRLFRTAFILLLIGLAFKESYYELSARVLYFYFIIEMILMILAFHAGKKKGVAFLIASYAFAINAINILGG